MEQVEKRNESPLAEIPDTTDLPVINGSVGDMLFNPKTFEHGQRIAKLFASANFTPQHYRNVSDCFVAVMLAKKLGADPFFILQNTYVVHGMPSWKGQAVAAMLNASAKTTGDVDYEKKTDDKDDTKTVACRAFITRAKDDKVVYGPWVTMEMVEGEGWLSKSGSKWRTMPEIMFMYRAATVLARTYFPDILLGLSTDNEVNDFIDVTPVPERKSHLNKTGGGYYGDEALDNPLDNPRAKKPEEQEVPFDVGEENQRKASLEAEASIKQELEADAGPDINMAANTAARQFNLGG